MQNQRGMVSMISSIIISLLLLVITLSMVYLMNNELRQSTDSDQSIRAYYAAEAGAEDAIWKVVHGQTTKQECGPANGSKTIIDKAGALIYTCQRIIFDGPATGRLNRESADQFETTSNKNLHSLRISWDTAADNSILSGIPANFPSGSSWGSGGQSYPAVFELSMVRYTDGALSANTNCAGSGPCMNTLVLKPVSSGGVLKINYSSLSPSINPYSVTCTGGSTYHCTVLLKNISPAFNSDYLARFRPRYAGTSYLFQGYTGANGNGATVDLTSSSVLIDVTAKAGDVSRRITERVRLSPTAANGLDYVLYSDTDISKNCKVSRVLLSTSSADCNP